VSFIGIFRDKVAVKGLLILFGAMFLQQLSGINAVLFFANDIFVQAGTELEPRFNSIIIGVVQVLATIPATLVVDKLGRKLLLIISAIAMAIFITILGFYFFFQVKIGQCVFKNLAL
jgi:Na+/melibiose symporter-like transporter